MAKATGASKDIRTMAVRVFCKCLYISRPTKQQLDITKFFISLRMNVNGLFVFPYGTERCNCII